MTSVYLLTSGLDGDLLAALKTEVLSVRRVRVGGGEGGRVGVNALHELLSVFAPTDEARVASP